MTELITFLTWLLALLAGAMLAVQIAYASTLAQDIKGLLGLTLTNKKWKKWFSPVGWLIDEIKSLSNCPYCLSVWICTAINYFMYDMNLLRAIVFGLLGIVYVTLWECMTLK